MRHWIWFLLPALTASAVDWTTNDSKSINWSAHCGVPGGIPNRSTIFALLDNDATATTINSSLSSCPSNQVVLLTNKVFTITGTIQFATRHGRTLRGMGMGQTVLNFTGAGSACITSDEYAFAGMANISSGYTKGSTSIVMSAALSANFSPGNHMIVRQDDDTNLVYTANPPGKHMAYLHRIETTNGTTITFSPPLMYGLTAGLTPQAGYLSGGPGALRPSIENMTILNTGARDDVIKWNNVYQGWITGCQISNLVQSALYLIDGLQCTIKRNYFHNALNFPDQTDGYGVYIYGNGNTIDGTSSFNLIEDNIAKDLFVGFWQTRSSGNAYIFNYTTNGGAQSFPHQVGIMNAGHGAHPMMCLWEGNAGEQWQHDGYHGSASHQTLFRNWIHGLHGTFTDNRKMCDITRGSYHYVVAGNIFGHSSWTPDQYEMSGSPDYNVGNVIYRLGYPNQGNNSLSSIGNPWAAPYHSTYPDAVTVSTLERVQNYDYKNSAIVNPTNGLPNSIFYADKPSYWGYLPWPAFDPSSPSSASATNIPAGWRYSAGYPYTNEVPNLVISGSPVRKAKLRGLRLK